MNDEYDVMNTRLRAESRASGGETVAFEIRVTAGPDTGRVMVADAAQSVLVGQSPVCTLRLTDPEVSRRHVSFEAQGATLRVTDLRSTNGTFVNGVRVYEAALAGGETVQVGGTVLRIAPRREQAGEASAATSFGPVLGASIAMRRVYPVAEKLALARVPVVIEGETGTGKELMAEALHRMGPRKNGPFVVFDCATTSTDAELALFGTRDEAGLFEQAQGGTLLFDEIADLPADTQGKLLRAIERGEVRRAGGNAPVAVDVRIIATTQRDLDAEVHADKFREDLYFRLAVARIEMPPLRKRLDDVPMLVRHFWWSLRGPGDPTPELVTRLSQQPFPGNVRELANAVTRAIALGDAADPALAPDTAPKETPALFQHVLAQNLPLPRAREKIVDAFERAYVAHVVAAHGGNVSRAAAASGLALRYFQVLRARQAKSQ